MNFEECSLDQATHVKVNDKVYLLGGNEVGLEYYHDECIGIRWREEDTFIPKELFSTLGINILRKIKREPREFVHIFRKGSSMSYPSWAENGMFRCVEISEEVE